MKIVHCTLPFVLLTWPPLLVLCDVFHEFLVARIDFSHQRISTLPASVGNSVVGGRLLPVLKWCLATACSKYQVLFGTEYSTLKTWLPPYALVRIRWTVWLLITITGNYWQTGLSTFSFPRCIKLSLAEVLFLLFFPDVTSCMRKRATSYRRPWMFVMVVMPSSASRWHFGAALLPAAYE